jgi:hypothetical protein
VPIVAVALKPAALLLTSWNLKLQEYEEETEEIKEKELKK